jgi:hypothetical protein
LPAWSHIEFDEGFLIWNGRGSQIDIWRRTSDNPLSADNPTERQQREHKPISSRSPQGVQTDDALHRGKFQPFTVLTTPTPTSASRYVHPHLVVATRNCSFAYIYDVPNARLLKAIPLEEISTEMVRYVEHSQKHIFVCTNDQVLVFRKSDAQRVFTLTKHMQLDQALLVAWPHLSWELQIMDRTIEAPFISDVDVGKISDYGSNFSATHISACGRILVVMLEAQAILVITGFDDEEPLRITGIMLSDALGYLAFDGYHIAIAGVSQTS